MNQDKLSESPARPALEEFTNALDKYILETVCDPSNKKSARRKTELQDALKKAFDEYVDQKYGSDGK